MNNTMIKKYFLLASLSILLLSFNACKEQVKEPENYTEIPWLSMGDVEKKINAKSKKVLVDVYTPWCGPCKLMDKRTFTDQSTIDLVSKNFYPVKFNAEGADPIDFKGKNYSNPRYDPAKANRRNYPHELSSFFQVRGYPSIVILDEQLNIIHKVSGYKTPAQLNEILQKFIS